MPLDITRRPAFWLQPRVGCGTPEASAEPGRRVAPRRGPQIRYCCGSPGSSGAPEPPGRMGRRPAPAGGAPFHAPDCHAFLRHAPGLADSSSRHPAAHRRRPARTARRRRGRPPAGAVGRQPALGHGPVLQLRRRLHAGGASPVRQAHLRPVARLRRGLGDRRPRRRRGAAVGGDVAHAPDLTATRARPRLPGAAGAGGRPRRGRPLRGPAGDLLALAMGCNAAVVGTVMALLPRLIHNSWAGPAFLRPLGLALVATGLPLCYAQLRQVSRRHLWATHLAAGAGMAGLGVLAAVPPPAWTGIALWWGIGGAVALLPWLRERSAGLDTSALRTRLALALATVTSLALVAAVAVSTTQEERLATTQARETLAVEARSVAQNVRDYVELNGARAATMAGLSAGLPLDSEVQRELLARSRPGYPDVTGLLLVGIDGRLLASDGGSMVGAETRRDIATAAATRAEAPVELAVDPASGHRLLLVAAPVVARDGRPVATVVM